MRSFIAVLALTAVSAAEWKRRGWGKQPRGYGGYGAVQQRGYSQGYSDGLSYSNYGGVRGYGGRGYGSGLIGKKGGLRGYGAGYGGYGSGYGGVSYGGGYGVNRGLGLNRGHGGWGS